MQTNYSHNIIKFKINTHIKQIGLPVLYHLMMQVHKSEDAKKKLTSDKPIIN